MNSPSSAFVFTRFAKSNGNRSVVFACFASSVNASFASCAGIEKVNAEEEILCCVCARTCVVNDVHRKKADAINGKEERGREDRDKEAPAESDKFRARIHARNLL